MNQKDSVMKVVIAVPGEFHAFTIAEQLETRQALERIYTSYPKYYLSTSICENTIKSIRHPEIIFQIGQRAPQQFRLLLNRYISIPHIKAILFDLAVCRDLKSVQNGLFLGFAGTSHRSLQRANELGFTTVVERSSAHIQTQKQLLDNEYIQFLDRESPITERYINREKKEYAIADYISTPSDFAYNSFLDHDIDPKRLLKIPFGVDISRYHPSSVENEKVSFLFVGAIDIQKGVHYLLDAWKEFDKPNAQLVLAGNISDNMSEYKDYIINSNSIKYLGWVDNIEKIYRSASVFVFPSIHEGSAMVTYEAMASGLPVITTYNSGWVGEDEIHGIEIPIRDKKKLLSAMNQLYEHGGKRDEIGKAARNLICSNFTEEHYGSRLYSEFASII